MTSAPSPTPATPDGDREAALAGETDGGDDVDGVAAVGDRRRMLVDHGVVDGAGVVVARVGRRDHVAVQGRGQVVEAGGDGVGCGCGHGSSSGWVSIDATRG
jgi:hypothetical protein